MEANTQSGFTLIELMVALAVAAVLLGIGVPSFADAIRNARIGAQYGQAVRSLYIARSEAVKSAEFVVVCARSAPESLQCGTKRDWANGWIVFVDADSSVNAPASVGAEDAVISLEPAISGDNTVRALAKLSSGGSPEEVAYVRYLPRGNANWQGGSVVVCDTARGEKSSRVANVLLTGSVQPGRPSGTESVPRDAFGALISCESTP